MAYKINGTTVVDNSRNVCACCVTSCCITASSRMDAPSGTTAQRPSSPATGSIYFDTDLGSLISYNGTDWAAVGGGGDFQYQYTFGVLAAFQDPSEVVFPLCCATNGRINQGMSAIYPHIDGGFDFITSTASFHCQCDQVLYYTSRPVEGTTGVISAFHSGAYCPWTISNAGSRSDFAGASTMTSPVPFGGLTPTSSKILYSFSPYMNGDPHHCDPYADVCCCLGGVLGFIDGSDRLSAKIRCYEICCCSSCLNCFQSIHPMRWVGAMQTIGGQSPNACCYLCSLIFTGTQCCGFAFGSGTQAGDNSCFLNSETYFWTIGGFNHDYFLKDDTTATEANSPMRATLYYNCNRSFPFVYNAVFDYDNKRYVGIIQGKCGGGYAVWCLCNTACSNTACWELCGTPSSGGLRQCWGEQVVTACCTRRNPGKIAYWAGAIWGMSNCCCDPARLWKTNGTSVESWNFSHYSKCTMPVDFFIDCDCNMRLFSVEANSISYCACTLIETVIPCAVGSSSGLHLAPNTECICLYYYNLCFKCKISGRLRLNLPHTYQNSYNHYLTHPRSNFTNMLNYDCANNRVAINGFIMYGHTTDCACCHHGGASMMIPVIRTCCTTGSLNCKLLFASDPYFCMLRIDYSGCCFVRPPCCNQCYRFVYQGSCSGAGSTLSTSCFCIVKAYCTGIALCSGFKCFSPTALMSPVSAQCLARRNIPAAFGLAKNNCTYGVGE